MLVYAQTHIFVHAHTSRKNVRVHVAQERSVWVRVRACACVCVRACVRACVHIAHLLQYTNMQ